MGLVIPILAGFFLWTGFAPFEFPLGPYFGIALLFHSLQERKFRTRLLRVSVVGACFFFPLLHWSGSYVGSLPWIALALLQTAIFCLLAILPFRQSSSAALLFASSFTMIEILRMKWPFGGFGWGRVGHTQVDLLTPLYPLIGVAGISFVVAFFSALLVSKQFRVFAFLPIVLLLGFIEPTQEVSEKVSVVAVQGGVDQLGIDFNQRAFSVLKRHVAASKIEDNNADLVIWPENSSDIDPIRNTGARAQIEEALDFVSSPLLIGAVLQRREGPENASILYDANKKIKSIYIKQDLAPFGEYMPLRRLAERIAPEAKRVRDFQAGKKWISHEIQGHTFKSVICFEVLDDDFLRAGLKSSSFVVAQTNNATFGDSPQARQQLQIIRARAAEFSRDFAVVSTTGYTAEVDSDGKIISRLPQFEPGALAMELELKETRTLASQIQSWAWFGLFLAILLWTRRSVFNR